MATEELPTSRDPRRASCEPGAGSTAWGVGSRCSASERARPARRVRSSSCSVYAKPPDMYMSQLYLCFAPDMLTYQGHISQICHISGPYAHIRRFGIYPRHTSLICIRCSRRRIELLGSAARAKSAESAPRSISFVKELEVFPSICVHLKLCSSRQSVGGNAPAAGRHGLLTNANYLSFSAAHKS